MIFLIVVPGKKLRARPPVNAMAVSAPRGNQRCCYTCRGRRRERYRCCSKEAPTSSRNPRLPPVVSNRKGPHGHRIDVLFVLTVEGARGMQPVTVRNDTDVGERVIRVRMH